MSCCPGCSPGCGCHPGEEDDELCLAASWNMEAWKLGLAPGRGSASAPSYCLGLLARTQIAMESQGWSHSPVSQEEPKGPVVHCHPFPVTALSTSEPMSSSLCFSLCSLPVCLKTMQPGCSRDASRTVAKGFCSELKGLSPRMWTFLPESSRV